MIFLNEKIYAGSLNNVITYKVLFWLLTKTGFTDIMWAVIIFYLYVYYVYAGRTWKKETYKMKKNITAILLGLIVPAVIIALWWYVTEFSAIPQTILPIISSVAERILMSDLKQSRQYQLIRWHFSFTPVNGEKGFSRTSAGEDMIISVRTDKKINGSAVSAPVNYIYPHLLCGKTYSIAYTGIQRAVGKSFANWNSTV